MINNLETYFLPEKDIYLENISYEKIGIFSDNKEYSLSCADSIKVNVNNRESVSVTVVRKLEFEPKDIFSLTVSYGALLKFDPEKVDEYNWHEINLADEFRENGDFITANLMSRITLQIAQITSSFGEMPLILPPNIVKKSDLNR